MVSILYGGCYLMVTLSGKNSTCTCVTHISVHALKRSLVHTSVCLHQMCYLLPGLLSSPNTTLCYWDYYTIIFDRLVTII